MWVSLGPPCDAKTTFSLGFAETSFIFLLVDCSGDKQSPFLWEEFLPASVSPCRSEQEDENLKSTGSDKKNTHKNRAWFPPWLHDDWAYFIFGVSCQWWSQRCCWFLQQFSLWMMCEQWIIICWIILLTNTKINIFSAAFSVSKLSYNIWSVLNSLSLSSD